jgi:hypothetical protein
MEESKRKRPASKPVKVSRCDDCEHYDYDDDFECYYCKIDLDEDEMLHFMSGNSGTCPYYKFYDEYKSVQKQN